MCSESFDKGKPRETGGRKAIGTKPRVHGICLPGCRSKRAGIRSAADSMGCRCADGVGVVGCDSLALPVLGGVNTMWTLYDLRQQVDPRERRADAADTRIRRFERPHAAPSTEEQLFFLLEPVGSADHINEPII